MAKVANAVQTHAFYTVAELLRGSGRLNLSQQDVIDLVSYEKTSGNFDVAEQENLRKLYWSIFYNPDKYRTEIDFMMASKIPPEENPFDSSVPLPIPESKDSNVEFTGQLSLDQINARLELARFLVAKHFKIKDRDSALRFVAKLISSDFIHQATLDNLRPENHAEFNRLLDRCLQISFTESIADVEQRKSNTRRIIDGISKILQSNKISIPCDVDDFMLKLATLEEFRANIYSSLQDDSRAMLDLLCIALIENEKEDESNEKYRQDQSNAGYNGQIGIEQCDR